MSIKNPINEKLDIFILAGQSNMEGNGKGGDASWQKNPRILMMNGEISTRVEKYIVVDVADEYYIDVADERTSSEGERCGILALPFAELYAGEMLDSDRKILLIQSSVGGCGFVGGHWGLSDNLYIRMMKMAKEALSMNPENRIKALLWHQGEHDAYENGEAGLTRDEIKAHYRKNLDALISAFRSEFGEDIPFISGGFTHTWLEEYPDSIGAVSEVLAESAEEWDNACFVGETQDLKTNDEVVGNGDTVHFSREGLNIFGKRYYAAYKKIVGAK